MANLFGETLSGKFCVYAHYKLGSDIPFYIGKGFGDRAFCKHNRNKFWKNVVNKYGFRAEIMFDSLSESLAFELEREYIKKWGRRDLGLGPLVNMTDGGEGSSNPSEESRIKKSKALKGKKRSKEYCVALSKRTRGHITSSDTKMKISLSLKGRITTDKTRKLLSIASKGRVVSEETKVKLRMKVAWNKGSKTPEETKIKMRIVAKGRRRDLITKLFITENNNDTDT